MSGSAFARRVAVAVADRKLIGAVRLATFRKVDQRAEALAQLRNSDELRTLAAEIKRHTIANLPHYLARFAAAAEQAGARVHLAHDAAEACRIVTRIARDSHCRLAVKAKSMTSEEIHLNAALQQAGVRVVETDLGEFIVQIDGDTPSHIVTPIIHKDRAAVGRAMQRALRCEYTDDPVALTRIAREHLREIFRDCDLGISGVNFAAADTGSICICTNEGNGRMTTTRPRVHVALMGIEKIIPRLSDLPVFLKLLARSSTGQPLTVYTTIINGPRRSGDADGPRDLHIVLLDNGRSRLLGTREQEVLCCIRCGACLNACPVYRNVGGHAYGSVYPGPIGALVTPLLRPSHESAELPRASSLCGACAAACPVRIDIPALLVRLRECYRGDAGVMKRLAFHVWRWLMGATWRYELAQRAARFMLGKPAGGWSSGRRWWAGGWTAARDLPAPRESFRQRWRRGLRDEA